MQPTIQMTHKILYTKNTHTLNCKRTQNTSTHGQLAPRMNSPVRMVNASQVIDNATARVIVSMAKTNKIVKQLHQCQQTQQIHPKRKVTQRNPKTMVSRRNRMQFVWQTALSRNHCGCLRQSQAQHENAARDANLNTFKHTQKPSRTINQHPAQRSQP